MSAIKLNELQMMAKGSTFFELANESKESKNLQDDLSSFISNSNGKLEGQYWPIIEDKLNEFSTVINKRDEVAKLLSDSIQKALNMLIDYFGDDYTSLDYSQLEVIQGLINKYNSEISGIQMLLNNSQSIDDIRTRNILLGRLEIFKNKVRELEKIANKIEGFKKVYNDAMNILQDAFKEVDEFAKMVNSITPNEEVIYSPIK